MFITGTVFIEQVLRVQGYCPMFPSTTEKVHNVVFAAIICVSKAFVHV